MKWIAISGSWRKIDKKVVRDVRKVVREIIINGNGIVSGGALGVDYIAVDEALKLDLLVNQIKIYLPTSLVIFAKHYRKRAREGIITSKQAEEIISQLNKIARANELAIIENHHNKILNKDSYYERNSDVVKAADELIAFHVNNSEGTQDAIDKAKKKAIPIKEFNYTID